MNSTLKILHLEDSSSDAELVKRCLKNAKLDCEIKVVDNKIDYQNSLKYFEPDVVLSDHSLPQFNSTEALKITQIRKGNTPFILVTGAVSEEFAVACIKNGADDYILKKNLTRLPSAILHAVQHRKAEENLVNSEKKFRDLFESNPMPMWVLDLPTFRFLSVNRAAVKHYGYSNEEFLNMTALDIRPEEDKEKFLHLGRTESSPHSTGIWRHVKKDGTIIHAEIRVSEIVFDGKPARLILSNDVTEKIIAEEKLQKSESQVRNFAAHLNKVLEDERSNLAREIHDELGQQLSSIKMGLSLMKHENIFSEGSKDLASLPNEVTDGKINKMMNDVDNTIQSLRNIATELRPGILDTLGLIPSIEWLAKEFEKKTEIKCNLQMKVKDQQFEKNTCLPDRQVSTCFFRICQEALTNISKHSGAIQVTISIDQNDTELIMKISDNGKGIATEKLENPFSMGLLGMRERANLIDARLLIISQKDLGTTIQLKANIKE